jgi:hypothetical protein
MIQMLGKIPVCYIFYDLTPFYIENKKQAYSNTPPLLLFRVTNEPRSRVGWGVGEAGSDQSLTDTSLTSAVIYCL